MLWGGVGLLLNNCLYTTALPLRRLRGCGIMADVQELPMDRAEVAARRDKDGLLDLLDAKLEHYLHTLHEYQEAMQQLSKELSSVSVPSFCFTEIFVLINKGLHVASSGKLPQFIFCDPVWTGLL